MHEKWSLEEIEKLKHIYQMGNLSLLNIELPNRTYSSCRAKARKLGFSTRKFWSKEEIDVLKCNYSIKTLDEMMELLPNRPRESIIKKATDLNLRNSCKFQEYETQYIIDNYKTMTDKEIGIALNRDWRAILDKRCRMHLTKEHLRTCYDDIYEYLRRNNSEWKNQSMKSCNYKCVITGGRFDEIHHLYGFNKIVNETLNALGIDKTSAVFSFDEDTLLKILNKFRELQELYPLGVCLRKDIHTQFHNIYGYGDNTIEQWNEFIQTI